MQAGRRQRSVTIGAQPSSASLTAHGSCGHGLCLGSRAACRLAAGAASFAGVAQLRSRREAALGAALCCDQVAGLAAAQRMLVWLLRVPEVAPAGREGTGECATKLLARLRRRERHTRSCSV